jgi:hypothetical protein
MPAFTPDGATAYLTCTDTHKLAILSVNGSEVRDTGRSVVANLRPVGIEISPKGDLAIVANIGNGPTGGVDTLTVVDIASPNPGWSIRWRWVSSRKGWRFPPRRLRRGELDQRQQLPAIVPVPSRREHPQDPASLGSRLTPVAEARVGPWCQGVPGAPTSARS